MNTGIDWIFILFLPVALFAIALGTGSAYKKTFKDMISKRLYASSLALSMLFLMICILLSESEIPDILEQIISTLTSIFAGTFLTVVVASMILLLLEKGALKNIKTIKTLRNGSLLTILFFSFLAYVDGLDNFMLFLEKYIPKSFLNDPSLALVGTLLACFFIYVCFWLYLKYIIPIINK